jgi:hypothetical protein
MTTTKPDLRVVPAGEPTATEEAEAAERAAAAASQRVMDAWTTQVAALALLSRGVAGRPSLAPGVRHDAALLAQHLDQLSLRIAAILGRPA